jgi:hypothetical protein
VCAVSGKQLKAAKLVCPAEIGIELPNRRNE